MPIQKIIANSSSEGLRRISEEFGQDALVLKTVKRNGRVEFFIEAEDRVQEEPIAPATESKLPEPGPNEHIREEFREARLKMLSAIAEQADIRAEQEKVSSKGADLRGQKSSLQPRARQRIQTELNVNSFLDGLRLTPGIAARLRGYKRIDEVTANLALMLDVASPATSGIFAFVGPAGSGKTTSLMKLVVQHVIEHGEQSCAIINCDHHSVGARERIDRFGELVGVDVLQVGTDLDLNRAIAAVAKRQLVVVDTPGLGPKSTDLGQLLMTLAASHDDISRCLVVPANLQYESMCQARKLYASKKQASCIATRMDEATSCGPILSFIAQSELPIRYLGTGTKIPDDLISANASELVGTAISLMGDEFAKAGLRDLTNSRSEDTLDPIRSPRQRFEQEKVMDL